MVRVVLVDFDQWTTDFHDRTYSKATVLPRRSHICPTLESILHTLWTDENPNGALEEALVHRE
jgi:hypothetical protein